MNESIAEKKELELQFEAIRVSGLTNMFDRAGVLRIAKNLHYFLLSNWIEDSSAAEYIAALREGFKL